MKARVIGRGFSHESGKFGNARIMRDQKNRGPCRGLQRRQYLIGKGVLEPANETHIGRAA